MGKASGIAPGTYKRTSLQAQNISHYELKMWQGCSQTTLPIHSQKSLCHYLRPPLQGPSLSEGTAHTHVAHFARSSVMGAGGEARVDGAKTSCL